MVDEGKEVGRRCRREAGGDGGLAVSNDGLRGGWVESSKVVGGLKAARFPLTP